MSAVSLTELQLKVLRTLGDSGLPWRLTGGGALILAYTHHRLTRDLDLFFLGEQLADAPKTVSDLLSEKGFEVSVLQSSPAFVRLKVELEKDSVLVDLVADSIAPIEEPAYWKIEGIKIRIDTSHEILVNKLCALLGRSELRDLVDLEALLEIGGDLDRAIAEAPRKDGGFSPLTLAWVLQGMNISLLGKTLGLSDDVADQLSQFRDKLVERIVASAGI